MAVWHDHIHEVIAENHPGAFASAAYGWVMDPETGEPFMQWWNEDQLGPLDLSAIQTRCEQLMLLPVERVIAKADLWRRCTDAEAVSIDAILTNPQVTPLRLRRVFEAAAHINTRDPDYPALKAGITAAVGAARANEILGEPDA
jgi:hypothetical protein